MANILFKKGSYSDFKAKVLDSKESIIDGALYLTEDEGGLYLGVNNNSKKDVVRIQGSLLIYGTLADFQNHVKPPYSTNVIYFISANNALVRWDDSANEGKGKWIQLNPSQEGIVGDISAIQELVNGLVGDVADLEAIAAKVLTKETVDGKKIVDFANHGAINLVDPTAAQDAATKNYVDTKITNDVIGTNDNVGSNTIRSARAEAAAAASAANDASVAAGTAQGTADGALALAKTKITLEDVANAGYATTTYVNGEIDKAEEALIGDNEDGKDDVTIWGAKNVAASALQKATDNKGLIDNLTETTDKAVLTDGTRSMAADLAMGTHKITGLATPTDNADAATKKYVDDAKAAVIGESTDGSSDNTIYGVHAHAAAAMTAAGNAQKTANDNDSRLDLIEPVVEKAILKDGSVAMEANLNINSNNVIGLANISYTDTGKDSYAVNKAYVDNTRTALTGTENDAAGASTISGANKAAAVAQQRADDAYTLAGSKATLDEVKDLGYATVTYVDNTKDAILGEKSYAGTVKGAYEEAASQAATTKTAVLGTNDDGSNFNGTVKGAYIEAAAASQAAGAAQDTADAALARAGGTMTGAINMGGNKITNLGAPVDDSDATTKSYVDTAIANGIKANDAMTFKGTVGTNATVSELPTSGVQKGDTYKVATLGTYAGVNAKVGDLFINVANDDTTPEWTHISSGYEDDYLQKLVLDDDTVYLTNGVNLDSTNNSGSLKVASSNDSLAVTTTAEGHDINISMNLVWGSF